MHICCWQHKPTDSDIQVTQTLSAISEVKSLYAVVHIQLCIFNFYLELFFF